ncbi:MAG: hypothetical protein JNK82_29775 [Myxococcaceae bacterium]|nr:hypothetical protein [Myxococcaceae bacterium]
MLLLVVCSCAASAPPAVTVAAGPWRATYREWAGLDVCETEPSWLREELDDVNEVLERFTARGGTWRDDELPVLEAAMVALPPLVEAHARNVTALKRCPGGAYAVAVERGEQLVAAARSGLDGAAKLVQFSKGRRNIEAWRKSLEAEREATRERQCRADAGATPVIYYAFGDELAGTTWLFCDGGAVRAPLAGSLVLEAGDERLRATYFELARVYPPGQVKHPPR